MGIAAIIGLAIGAVEIVFQIFIVLLKIFVYLGQFVVAALNWTVDAIRSFLLWVGAWLGPLSTSVWGALQPAEIQRAAILAFGVMSVLWMAFSTVANDVFYVMINPFFFNIFSTVGHFGFSLASGAIVFLWDAVRRMFHGPTKTQHLMMKKWDEDLLKRKYENIDNGISK